MLGNLMWCKFKGEAGHNLFGLDAVSPKGCKYIVDNHVIAFKYGVWAFTSYHK